MTNTIHFIWYQGFNHAPDDLRRVPEQWRTLNPDYEIGTWNKDLIRSLIHGEYPQYRKFFEQLGEGETQNIRIVKCCDFGRLLILHHYGGWYADLDCLPLQPMSTLDGTLSHHLTPFSYSRDSSHPTILGADPAPLTVDLESYEMIFSREHLPNRELGGYPVSNTMFYARPGSPLLLDLIEHCVGRAKEKVLEFAGPRSIARWMRSRTDLKGKVLVLPPYYFLWQTHDMGPPWDGAISQHLNRLDWGDAQKDAPWDI